MMNYTSALNFNQREKAEPNQVKNNAGGFVFALDKWARLERFLILGAEGGTYYTTERKLTQENALVLKECLKENGLKTVQTIVQISEQNRAPKNDACIFALAVAASDSEKITRHAALSSLGRVCRIPTHLFMFLEQVQTMRGWGRGLKNAVAKWYSDKDDKNLMYHLVKYQNRNGWSHKDALRLSHPEPKDKTREAIYRYAVKGELGSRVVKRKNGTNSCYSYVTLPDYLQAFEELKHADVCRTIELISQHKFTHEMVSNEVKNNADVWAVLSENMPMTAMVRNLAKMTAVGLLRPMGGHTRMIAEKLTNQDYLVKSRMHPIQILSALRVYQQGHGDKGSSTWSPVWEIIDALDEAFYLSFGHIEPTGKNICLALDVSGSMSSGNVAGIRGLTPREASAAMAMATMRTEKNYATVGFCGHLVDLQLSGRQRLDDVIKKISDLPFGRTDCALPMLWATQAKVDFDVFQIYTDNETWFGNVHPYKALNDYRRTMNKRSKLAVFGMTSSGFTIGNPNDADTLDFVGLDAGALNVLADWVKNC